MIVDFTKFPVGAAPDRSGTIQRCPVCGHNGQRRANQRSKKQPWLFVHSLDVTVSRVHSEARVVASCKSAEAGDSPVIAKMTQTGL